MKKTVSALLALLMLFSFAFAFAVEKEPKLIQLYELNAGDETTAPKGKWESEDETVASVDKSGKIKALKEGYTRLVIKDKKGKVTSVCEVNIGRREAPKEVKNAVESAINEWKEAEGKVFKRYNKYTKWYRENAYKGFGWCGAFVGFNLENSGVKMEEKYRTSKKDPIEPKNDGSLFGIKQASQTRLYEGFFNYKRISHIPQVGYYIIYGRKGSTPYTHIGLVAKAEYLGEGKYALETVEGNVGGRIKRFAYIYDSLEKKREKNIKKLPDELRKSDEGVLYDYIDNFYLNCFGQTWH